MTIRDRLRSFLELDVNVGWVMAAFLVMIVMTWGAFALHEDTHSEQIELNGRAAQVYAARLDAYDLCVTQLDYRNEIRDVLHFIFVEGSDISDTLRSEVGEYVENEFPVLHAEQVCGERPEPPDWLD
jgi:hypothetical protein